MFSFANIVNVCIVDHLCSCGTTLISDCWIEINDVHGLGGISRHSTTLGECKRACINNNKCVAIDWEPSNAQRSCWILTFLYIRPTTQTGVITQYRLDRTCLG